ncbi:MAG TPA: NFACT RNA binding domain-containing protein [Armatimonadota bacterium]|jgi:predicted ribosome quality control (RQC) complex YloA/Tae2 family protein
MVFDSLVLYSVAREISARLTGAGITRLFLISPDTAVLEFGVRAPLQQLLISWSTEHPRVHLSTSQQPRKDVVVSFADVLRRYLKSARLESVQQVGFDRVLRLEFTNVESLGPNSRCSVVVEPIGRWANALVLSPDGMIKEAARHVYAAVNRYRELIPGERYHGPPGEELPPLSEVTPEQLQQAAAATPERTLKTVLSGGFQGAGPVLLAEVWARTGLDPDTVVAAQPAGWPERLAEALAGIMAEAAQPGAYIYRPATGRPFVYPIALVSQAGTPVTTADSLSEALETTSAEQVLAERLRQQRERLHAALERAAKLVLRRRQAREAAKAKADEAHIWRDYGEALLANLWRIPAGASQVEVPLYTEEGERLVTVALNPGYPAQDNAQKYFERYKKATRATHALPQLLRADRQEEAYLEALGDQIEWSDEGELAELEQELRRRGYLKKLAAKGRARPSGRDFHRFSPEPDWAIFYGKTGLQNDRVLREATSEDLWMHVRDGSGGHVLIRTGGRPDLVPETVLHLAARIAAGLSRQRTSGSVEVSVTAAKNVRRPKGTPPGFVLYDDYYTLAVEPLYPPPEAPADPS